MAQSPPTPDNDNYDQEFDAVGLGLHDDDQTVLAACSTDPQDESSLWTYPHGYSVRLRVAGAQELLDALDEIGVPMGSEEWCHVRREPDLWRAVLRGSVSLGARKPGFKGNTTSPMARFNRRHSIAIYSFGVEARGDDAFLDIAGVRVGDIATFVEGVLGLSFVVDRYRRMERYVVLTPYEAQRLQVALGHQGRWGRGSDAAKYYLIHDHRVPVMLGRSRRTVLVKLYRIGPGATAAYRLEAHLAGRSRDRAQFGEEVADVLDSVLLGLLVGHGLTAIAKPSRWEPVLRTAASEAPRDSCLRRVRPSGWRGCAPSADIALLMAQHRDLDCNTPPPADTTVSQPDLPLEVGSSRIRQYSPNPAYPDPIEGSEAREREETEEEREHEERQEEEETESEHSEVDTLSRAMEVSSLGDSEGSPPLQTHPHPTFSLLSGSRREPRLYLLSPGIHPREGSPVGPPTDDEPISSHPASSSATPPRRRPSVFTPSTPYASILHEVGALPGLYEVILNYNQDPTAFLRELEGRFKLAVEVIAADDGFGHLDTWTAVGNMAHRLRLTEDSTPEAIAIVVDPSYLRYFHTVFAANETLRPGPLMSSATVRSLKDPTSAHWIGMAGALGDLVRGLRGLAETHGARIVLVSQDARPARGRGPWEKAQAYRDTRVRSTLGAAGLHYAHQRYYVSTTGTGEVMSIVTWKDEHEGLTGRILMQAFRPRKSSSRRELDGPRPKDENSTETTFEDWLL